MKKRNLNSKKMRLLSVGLLTSSAVLSVTDVQPIVAKEIDHKATEGSEKQEDVKILSSTKEHETTESTVEGIETSSSVESSSTSTTEESTEETSSESTSTTDDTSSTQDTTESTSSSSTSSSSTDSTTSSTTSSSTSTSSSTTTPSKPKPKPKPKPQPSRPSRPNTTPPAQSGSVQQPSRPNTNIGNVTGSHTGSNSPSGSDQVFHISPNLTTKSFVKVIGEDARAIAGENNLYASVMIAQAILESASGNSALASAPNYNLFGIKGSYEGASANFLTSEDNGSGSMFTIRSNFRKYPSYKESLGDYVKLLRGGTDYSNAFYSGTWKTNTKSYKDATKFLTGRYATDTSYNSKLNGLIDAYNLTQYDTLKDKKNSKKAKKITLNTKFDKIEKKDAQKDQAIELLTHTVKKGESLKSISDLYNISTLAILEKNQLDRRMLFIGQKLSIPRQQEEMTTMPKEAAVDRSLEMVQKLSNAFTGKETTSSSTKNESKTATADKKIASKKATKETSETKATKSTSETKVAKATKETSETTTKDYKVSATRKKTKETYEVKKGDTLASISKKTGISVWSLKEWNDLDQYFLTEGQQLILGPVYDLQS
ncbi:glucosaminidase domain-containing protein [Enterococcus quebecensis]|uniref:Peptidoglycan hydrolase n=1 Tax=Enterococcus quebecensis TaxID=903983 RepID=A0A1E5GS23_9ENTE|nr:glucosaminidase domain-containing protein [Enterococcus quebecensis]OEG15524.1 hypothetical protein BCR23_08635 [Enterococcus quebecensis]OJG74699.1 hypothetical protein RV12_GL002454 [Enterococcus quebecensis]